MKRVFSKSMEPNNPAVWVEILDKDGKKLTRSWLFLKYPGMFETLPGTEDDLIFTDL